VNISIFKRWLSVSGLNYGVAVIAFLLLHSLFLKYDGQNVPFIAWGYNTESTWLPLLKAGIVFSLFTLMGVGFYLQDLLQEREQRLAVETIDMISL
jgi:hypothetical protein